MDKRFKPVWATQTTRREFETVRRFFEAEDRKKEWLHGPDRKLTHDQTLRRLMHRMLETDEDFAEFVEAEKAGGGQA